MTLFRPRTLLPALLLAATLADAAPVVEPDTVTVGRASEVRLHLDAAGQWRQAYFRPGGPYLQTALPMTGARAIAVAGDLAVVALTQGLAVARLDGPAPRLLGTFSHRGGYEHVQLAGGRALLSAGTRLDILDLSDPAQPRPAGHYETRAPITALAAEGDMAALLSGGELLLLDTGQPSQSRRLARLALSFPVTALRLHRGTLYLAAGEQGLLTMDLRDPTRPRMGGHYPAGGPVLDVDIRGSLALLASGEQGLTLLDVADPTRPRWLGSHQQLGEVRRVRALPHGQALVSNARGDLLLLDIARPAMPSMLSALTPRRPLLDFAPGPTQPLVLQGNGLATLLKEALPPQIGNEGLDFGQGVNYGGQRRLVIRDGIAYVADWFSGIHIYDLGEPRRPHLLASLHTPGSPKGIVVRGDIAYVADDDHGLQVVDIADPRKPRLIANLATPGLAYTPVLEGERLYLASHRGGFQIIDIGDPAEPRLLSSLDTPGKAWSIQVRDGLAYVADDEAGLLIYQVTGPETPRLIGRFSPGTAAEDVLIRGAIAYVAFFDDGLYVLDISDPRRPRRLAHLATPGNARGLERQGDLLYVADWLAGIHIVDIADPRQPRLVGSYDTEGAAWGVRVAGRYAYVADWWGGLFVLDVDQPARPRLAGSYLHHDRVAQIATRGKYAFVAKGTDGLQVFDINNPLNPTWVTGVDLPAADAVVLRRSRAYLATPRGIAVVDIGNPFQARLAETLPLDHPVALLRRGGRFVYAAAGRALSLIDSGSLTISRHTLPYAIADLGALADTLFILDEAGVIHSYPGADLRHPGPSLRLAGQAGPGLLRAADRFLYVYREGAGIQILRRTGDGLLEAAGHIATAAPLRDLQARGDTLYAVTADRRILVYARRGDAWRIRGEYRTLNPVAALHLKGDTLYLGGSRQIVAIRDLPPVVVSNDSAMLPPTLPTGAYDLVLRKDDGGLLRRYPNALTVTLPRFKQPAFTMEDLQKALQRHRANNAGPAAP